ncbi:MAG: EamA family transporter, partial [Acidobacteriota bacterium]
MTTTDPGFRVRQILAFLAVYIIWGSTYLAIRVAVETLPPFSMAAVRFLVAGGLLLAWCLWRGIPMPTAREWRSAFVIGGLLLLGGNGAVVWAVQYIDSGLAALLVAVEPLIVVLLLWAGGER